MDVRHRDDIANLNISFPLGTMPAEWTIKIKQSYYAAVKYIDDMVGALMAYVDLNSTVVVLTSDHGKCFPSLSFFLSTFSLSNSAADRTILKETAQVSIYGLTSRRDVARNLHKLYS